MIAGGKIDENFLLAKNFMHTIVGSSTSRTMYRRCNWGWWKGQLYLRDWGVGQAGHVRLEQAGHQAMARLSLRKPRNKTHNDEHLG